MNHYKLILYDKRCECIVRMSVSFMETKWKTHGRANSNKYSRFKKKSRPR